MEKALAEQVHNSLKESVLDTNWYAGEFSITIDRSKSFAALKSLKEDFGFNYLADISTVDHYTDEQRFEVQYNLFNLDKNQRLRVKVFIEEDHPEVDSVVEIWKAANWHEREAYDMMGIRFKNHPDLRRMFMPEDFEYYPLRKEFPLIGIPGSISLPEREPRKP